MPSNDGLPERIDYGQSGDELPPPRLDDGPDDDLLQQLPTVQDDLLPVQREMLKQLDNFTVVPVRPHPHAEVSGLVPPNERGQRLEDRADPSGCLDRPPSEFDKFVDIAKVTGTLGEMQATLIRIMALVEDDHKKIHALEKRTKEQEDQLHNLVQRLAEKQDKPRKDGEDDVEPTGQPSPRPPDPTDGGGTAYAERVDRGDEAPLSTVRYGDGCD